MTAQAFFHFAPSVCPALDAVADAAVAVSAVVVWTNEILVTNPDFRGSYRLEEDLFVAFEAATVVDSGIDGSAGSSRQVRKKISGRDEFGFEKRGGTRRRVARRAVHHTVGPLVERIVLGADRVTGTAYLLIVQRGNKGYLREYKQREGSKIKPPPDFAGQERFFPDTLWRMPPCLHLKIIPYREIRN